MVLVHWDRDTDLVEMKVKYIIDQTLVLGSQSVYTLWGRFTETHDPRVAEHGHQIYVSVD